MSVEVEVRVVVDGRPTRTRRKRQMPRRQGCAWTNEEDIRLCRRFLQGVSISDLALLHERTNGAIITELRKIGALERRVDAVTFPGAAPQTLHPGATPQTPGRLE